MKLAVALPLALVAALAFGALPLLTAVELHRRRRASRR